MKKSLLFDFTVNKESNTINVNREFAAPLDMVWDAWTKPEILDQWWAPKPWKAKTKSMDFKVGGTWLYAMVSPANEAHWCKADYQKIEEQKNYSLVDAFCDENGNVNSDFPRSQWTNVFTGNTDTTTVNISIKYEHLADLQKIIELGFKEGFSMGLENLDRYLEEQLTFANKTK